MFHDGVITMDGLELDTKIRAGLATAVFTSIKFGDGLYDGTEDLSQCSGMKSVRQSFGISSICVIDKKQVRLRTVTDNTGIEEGYYISELGVYAEDPDKGEILYSLSLGVPQKMDYQPSETELAGATGTFDVYTDVSNVEEATVAVGTGAAASAEDLDETNTRVDGLMNPEFEDYSGEGAEVPDAREAIANIRSKKGFTGIMSNIKAALMGLVTLGDIRGMLVNNGLCSEAGKFFLDAAYGKNLQDQLTKLNSDFVNVDSRLIRASSHTSLDVPGNEQGVHHRLQINSSGSAVVYHSDSSGGNWQSDPIAMGNLANYFKNNDLTEYTDDCNNCRKILSFINAETKNTPYKQVGQDSSEGFLISIKPYVSGVYNGQYAFILGDIQGKHIWFRYRTSVANTTWTVWYAIA